MRFNASTPLQKENSKWRELVYTCFGEKPPDISGFIEDSDAENTKKQRKYAVSRMYLKINDTSCLINSFAKSNSLFWYYIKQIMNVFIRAMVRIFSFGERWNVLFNSAIASLNRTFHLSPHENVLTIALINIHYLYIIPLSGKTGYMYNMGEYAYVLKTLYRLQSSGNTKEIHLLRLYGASYVPDDFPAAFPI